jgi:hypothetical protein
MEEGETEMNSMFYLGCLCVFVNAALTIQHHTFIPLGIIGGALIGFNTPGHGLKSIGLGVGACVVSGLLGLATGWTLR